MINEQVKLWIRAVRPFSFTATIFPVTAGALLAVKEVSFQPVYFLISLIGALFLHSAINFFSDRDDYVNNIDTIDSYGSSGVLLEGLLEPRYLKKAGKICLVLGLLVGIFLSIVKGAFVLELGLLGALAGYSYTGKPLKLKYRGLGAPLVFMIFGPLMTLGGYYVQAQKISLIAILVSIPLGLLTTAVMHANDVRDIYHDSKAGIKSLSIIVGLSNAQRIYYGLLLISFASIIIMSFYKIIPIWSLLCLLTLPSTFKNIKKMYLSGGSASSLATLDQETAKLHAQFGTLLIISMIFSSFIK